MYQIKDQSKLFISLLSFSFLMSMAMLPVQKAYAKDADKKEDKAVKSEAAPNGLFTEAQNADLDNHIRNFILNNPEVLIEAVDRYRIDQQKLQADQEVGFIKKYQNELFGKDNPSIGPKDAKIVITEFFDYNCGYCKRALEDVVTLTNEHKEIRFVFKELPILSPTSETAARWALASQNQGKYFEYHKALMNHKGEKDPRNLESLAKEVGLDVAKLRKDANSASITKHLAESNEVAKQLSIQGTPAFVVGETIYRGYLGLSGMRDMIKAEQARLEKQK
jgi:protein-disulfide isomerase